jgi:hypothetical protein
MACVFPLIVINVIQCVVREICFYISKVAPAKCLGIADKGHICLPKKHDWMYLEVGQ